MTTLRSEKGGRGNIAPYETTHARIPVAIRERVSYISTLYKEACENETQAEFMISLDKSLETLGHKSINATQYNNFKFIISDDEKKEIASYIQQMLDVYVYCLKVVDNKITNINPSYRQEIATAIFVSTMDKFNLR